MPPAWVQFQLICTVLTKYWRCCLPFLPMSCTFALVLLCWAFPFSQLNLVVLLPPAAKCKSWFPAQVLNGQQMGNGCSSSRGGKRGCFGRDSEMQAEKSFRKRKGVTRGESESGGEMLQGPEVACSAEARLKARGNDWPVLLTCPGSRDVSPALEGDKVCKIHCGGGIGLGCAVLECDFRLERTPLCYREKTGDTETGAGGYREHWAQLVMTLHSRALQCSFCCLLLGSWEHLEELGRIRDPWMSIVQRCSCAKAESRDRVEAPSPPHRQVFH